MTTLKMITVADLGDMGGAGIMHYVISIFFWGQMVVTLADLGVL
jgi:hypothetical protein